MLPIVDSFFSRVSMIGRRRAHRGRPSMAPRIAMVAVVAVVAGTTLASVEGANAADAQTTFSSQSFTLSSVSNVLKPTAPAHTNAACLTAGNITTATPVPGCSSTAIDASGSGALRLTGATGDQEGGVGATQSVPISKGLDTVFDSYQYGGNSADGIVFYLAVTDPYNPAVPTTIGSAGGSLGYSAQTTTSAGLANGYLGLGLDVYGNYYNSTFGGTGCSGDGSGSGTTQPSVAVRGPGNNNAGYCLLTKNNIGASGSPDSSVLHGTTRANSDVPVEVVINSATTAVTSNGFGTKLTAVSVPAGDYAIVYKPIGQTQKMLQGALPTYSAYSSIYAGKSSWFNSAGLPYKLTYGWVASTGGNNDVHEVNQFTAQTVSGPVPALTATSSFDTSTPATGTTGTYTVTPTVASTGGTENENVVVTTTFPTGTTPPAYGTTGTSVGSYTCTTSGPDVTCTYPSSGQNIAAGTALPALPLPYRASGTAGTAGTISSTVSSVDATTVTASQAITISTVPTTTTVTASPTPSTSGSSVTLTATVTPGSGGSLSGTSTMTFTDTTTNTVLCSNVTVPASGIATCTTSALTPGPHSITAAYSGNTAVAASSGTTSETVNKITSTGIAVSAAPATFGYGATSTLTASGITSGATGAVTFTAADGTVLCSTTISSGTTASCTTATSLPVGSYAVTANYAGDTTHASASSSSTPITVNKATRSTTATADSAATDTVTYSTAATLNTTGLTSPAGATAPTGSITYTDAAGNTLCTATLPATSCPTPTTLGAGSYTVTSTYSGDTNYAKAVSSTATLTVTKTAAPTLTAAVDKTTSTYGDTLTFSATGVPAGTTGTVTFTDSTGTVLCATAAGASSCTTTPVTAGVHSVTATYSGDANHTASTASTPVTATVSKAAGTVAERINGNPDATITYGTAATLSAASLPAGADPTSALTFTIDGVTACTTTVATPTCATSSTVTAGDHTVTVTWAGDANHTGITSTPGTLTVQKQTANIQATADGTDNDTITHGQQAALDTTGIPDGATGTVTYTAADGTVLCTVDLAATNGDASCPTATSLAAGTYQVTASYSGDKNHAAATADPIQLVVAKAKPALTETVNGGSAGTTAYGTGATLDVTNLPADATGTIQYTDDNGNVLCTATITTTSGSTSCDTSATLPVGDYKVTATYLGDDNYEPFTTATPADLTVVKQEAATLATGSADGDATATVEHAASTTLTTAGLPDGATGSLVYRTTDGTILCTVPDVTQGTDCTTTINLPTGNYDVVTDYSGDANHDKATSTTSLALTVTKQTSSITATVDGKPTATTTFGTAANLALTGLPDDATGTVTFTAQDGTVLWTGDVSDLDKAGTPATLAAGTHTITATYSGDDNHTDATADTITLTVTPAGTDLTATADGKTVDTIAYGTAPNLDSTGFDTGTGTAATGTIRYVDGVTLLCTATLPDTACDGPTDLSTGDHNITAVYSGDDNHAQATSDPFTVTVVKAAADVTATVNGHDTASVTYGTAADLGLKGLAKGATGTVTFTDQNGNTLWTGDVTDLDSATTATDLPAGTYTITALYGGDANHEAELAADITLTVTRAPVDLNLATPDDTVFGTAGTLSTGPLPKGATGTITFTDADGTVLCTATLPDTSCSTPAGLAAGDHKITAKYSGDDNHAPAADGPATLTVAKAPTQVGTGTGTTPTPVTVVHGTPTIFTPTGLPKGATGTVKYVDQNGNVLCTVDLTAGQTSCTTDKTLPGGSYTVTPVYSGDPDHAGSTGDPITVTVTAQTVSLQIHADASSTTWGDGSTLTVTALPADATGTVTFRHGTTILCTVTLPTHSCTTSGIEPGRATITASYSGDASYAATTATAPLTVKAIATVNPKPVVSHSGTSITATWPAIPGATTYRVIVSTSKNLADAIKGSPFTASRSATSLEIDNLDPGTTYYYRVIAYSADGTILGTHDAIGRTPAPVDAALGQLAFTGSAGVPATIAFGLLLMALGSLTIILRRRRRS